ncbi:MAG TPA: DUF1800 family protein [Cyclobacteriaceae bacterium]|nr:DUF1800 family protein [Cyclobacteriaceae bacterium]
MPLAPFSGPLGLKRAAHLLRRATFGPNKSDIDTFSAMTAADAVQQLFQGTLPTPDAPIDPETGKEWAVAGTIEGVSSGEGDLQEYFKGWFIAQMMSSGIDPALSLKYSAREKIVFFIHTVLTAITTKIDSSRALYFQNQLFRMFALDKDGDEKVNFKVLTKKVSVDNAMLRLLDGNLNVNGSPNENYARELLELYTIGRGLEGHVPETTQPGDYYVYREQDVQAAARVLSGWDFDNTFKNIDPDTLLPRGKTKGSPNASSHDNTSKTFSDRFEGQVIQRSTDQVLFPGTNATEATAYDEISQLIDMIYSKRETALNICRRVYRFYVYHQISQEIDNTIISELADTFTNNEFKLQPVLEELFRSQHFYDAAAGVTDDNFGGIIRSPLDLMLGTYRMFEITLPDYKTAPAELYKRTGAMLGQLSGMGMNFYEPYDVAGYDAYHQFPIFHRAWISTNYLTMRYDFIRKLLEIGMMEPGVPKIEPYQYVFNKIAPGTASNAKELIKELIRYWFPQSDNLTFDTAVDDNAGLTAERLNYFLSAFLKAFEIDTDPEGAWTDRWLHPEKYQEPEVVVNQLKDLFNALMQSPEYQLY